MIKKKEYKIKKEDITFVKRLESFNEAFEISSFKYSYIQFIQ